MIKIMDIPFHQRKRQINKKNNRESIITSSRKILTEKGIDNASVREIVSIANLGSGTFYNYFDDKNAVFLIIIDRLVSEFSVYFMKRINEAQTFDQIVKIAFSSWFNWILDEEENYLFIKNNRKYILDLKWLSAHSKEYARFNNNLYEFVIDISKKTKFPQNDISFMITSVMAVCINLGDEMLTRSDVSPDDASNFATKLFLKGL